MTNELFERLLYEEEGTTIDFKKEQYCFVKAADEEKSELLKDILGFGKCIPPISNVYPDRRRGSPWRQEQRPRH